jgi:hypothetical protein
MAKSATEPWWLDRRPAPMSIALRLLLATFLVLPALAACSGAAELPVATGPLVTVTTRGGECFDGPCGSTVVIDRSGAVRQAAPGDAELGQVPADVLTALDAAIKTTDFDAVRAIPFDGECPVNFDGQEFIYEFAAPGGIERVASCEARIDPAHPAFAAVTAALVAVGVLPTP